MIRKLATISLVLAFVGCGPSGTADKPTVIRLDYATYNPPSLVLKEKGWLEEEFASEGIAIEWVQSQGSNRALSFLQSNAVDFGSTAGAAALVSASNGNPIYLIYLYSKPEWAALVTLADSPIRQIQDLKGKRVAATLGTDPYIFLLRSLALVGLTDKDIELVPLQHGEGAQALANRQVDAWAGLDPHMARLELETGARLFYRNTDFNTYGVLNVRREFADKYSQIVERVLRVYERAKKWIIENPDEIVSILANVAQISPEVARVQLTQRTSYAVAIPDRALRDSILEAGKVLQAGGHIKPEVDLERLTSDLLRPEWAQRALQ